MKSVDQLLSEYCARWKGFRVDGRGHIVPVVKLADIPPLATKGADFKVKASYDAGEKQWLGGVANAKEVDRMNEVLDPTGIIAGGYMKNSVLLYQHDHNRPLGLVTQLRPEESGVYFEGWNGDPKAGAALTKTQEEARSLVAQRVLKAVSVGFIPHKIRMPAYDNDGNMVDPAMIEQWEMLELSIVSVPCNAGALFDLKDGDPAPPAPALDPAFAKRLIFPTLGSDGKFSNKHSA